MRITALEEYGLRCLVQLARHTEEEPLTIPEIAQREGLSLPYVAKLMTQLRQAGLVASVRGRSGGYVLPESPDRITLDRVVEALGGGLFESDHCDRYPASQDACVHSSDCSIRSVWGAVQHIIRDVLSRTTLADLLRTEEQVVQIMKNHPAPPWPYGSGPGGPASDRGVEPRAIAPGALPKTAGRAGEPRSGGEA